jgi:hypothetical protein
LKKKNVLTPWQPNLDDDIEKLSASLLEKTRIKDPDVKGGSPKVLQEGFSPEKETALRQYLQRKGTTKVKPDPELSKINLSLNSSNSDSKKPPQSKDLIHDLKIKVGWANIRHIFYPRAKL